MQKWLPAQPHKSAQLSVFHTPRSLLCAGMHRIHLYILIIELFNCHYLIETILGGTWEIRTPLQSGHGPMVFSLRMQVPL